jgi:hypothetical protein
MQDIQSTIASSANGQIEFLLTNLSLAFSFLDAATATLNPETRKRNQRNARKIHQDVMRFAGHPVLAGSYMGLVWERLADLKRALEPLEENLPLVLPVPSSTNFRSHPAPDDSAG